MGLKAIIAIHNTVIGPGLGGVRFWNYNNESEALFDVLRLSRGMSLKAAAAGIELGGAKAVIIGDPNISSVDREALFRRFGSFVNSLSGKYITAEDVGVGVKDMVHIKMETDFVSGLPERMGGSGDPSPVTAYGTYLGIKVALKHKSGDDDVQGKKIIIKGVGKVGYSLANLLAEDGAELVLYDINTAGTKEIAVELKKEYGVKVEVLEDEDKVWDVEGDVFSPCALGGELNEKTIPRLKVPIVAGAANNQLLDEEADGKRLKDRGILYAPDFVINAGGLINVYAEVKNPGYYDEDEVEEMVEVIPENLEFIFKDAEKRNITTHQSAIELAERRIKKLGHIKKFFNAN